LQNRFGYSKKFGRKVAKPSARIAVGVGNVAMDNGKSLADSIPRKQAPNATAADLGPFAGNITGSALGVDLRIA
jgi:hypothetical protein